MAPLREDGADCLISLHVVCKSSRNAVVGVKNAALVVAVRAAPSDGAANDAVLAVLSAAFGCPKSHLTLVRGHKNREKTVRVAAMSADQIQHKLEFEL
ncbi:MAG TPA: DUF167 domain-containing protein [Abditibacterium sp.]|jgi:hypothetical protein